MSKTKTKETTVTTPVPRDESELRELCLMLTLRTLDREKLIAERDLAIQMASEPFTDRIGDLDTLLDSGLEALKTWAAANKERFGNAQSILVGGQFRLGWRLGNWATKLRSKVKWDHVINTFLSIVEMGAKSSASKAVQERAARAARYLREKVEPNKEAMLNDRDNEDAAELLSDVGVTFVQERTFYMSPAREGQDGAELNDGGNAKR